MGKGDVEPKVLTIAPNPNGYGGISTVIDGYRRCFADFTSYPTNNPRGRVPGMLLFMRALAVMPFYRLRGYSVVHVHVATGKSFFRKKIVLGFARMLGYKTVYHSHAGGIRAFVESAGKKKICRTLHKCDAVIVLGNVWKKYFENELGCKRVYIVNNFVEPLDREPDAPVAGEVIQLLFIGKICDNKGIYDLLEALERHRDEFEGRVKVRFAGPGETEKLTDHISSHNLGGMAEYIGCIEGESKDAELRRCDALILPSHFEGMPMVLLEAANYGRACISTRVGSVDEIVDDGETGRLVPPHAPEELAEAIRHYLNNRGALAEDGRRARQKVKSFYPDAVEARLKEIYKEL